MRDNEAIYKRYLEKLKTELIGEYQRLGLKASGDYGEGLEYEIEENVLRMVAPYHSWFMEHGREPSKKFPPRMAIERWIEVKRGLPAEFKEKKKQFAYLIARKIAEEGIKVPNTHNAGAVISKIVNEFFGKTVYDMLEELGLVYLRRIKSDILKQLKNVDAEYA